MFFCCECCVLSRRGLYDELLTRPEESYRLSAVVARALETSFIRSPWPAGGCCAKRKEERKTQITQAQSLCCSFTDRIDAET